MRVSYITNARRYSGVGHRAFSIRRELDKRVDLDLQEVLLDGVGGEMVIDGERQLKIHLWPGVLGSKSIHWIRLGRAYQDQGANIFHLTNQTLSFLAKKLRPSVVTVHDIIELTDPQDRKASWLNRYLYSGIGQAGHIIAVSEYTKRQVQEHYGIAGESISVIPNGVDREVFYPMENFHSSDTARQLQEKLGVSIGGRAIVLYVGSDHPRKNGEGALQVFAKVREHIPEALFIKFGAEGLAGRRRDILQQVERLGLGDAVYFVDEANEAELNGLYNLADVLLFPSRVEGFGLPPLQAMAAGLPVVCSNATSLPEVVGEAALTADPDDEEALVTHVLNVLNQEDVRQDLITRGLERAKQFSWEKAAEEEMAVYEMVCNNE